MTNNLGKRKVWTGMKRKADSGGASSGPFHDRVVVLPTFVCVMYFTKSEKFFFYKTLQFGLEASKGS